MTKFTREDYTNWPEADYEDFIQDSGHLLFYGAFLETTEKGHEHKTKYTLRVREHGGYPSAYQIIVNAKSEYDAAMKLCGDWSIWERWKASEVLWNGKARNYRGTGLKAALASLSAKRTGEAMANIIRRSEDGDYRASKDLVTWGLTKLKTGKKVNQVPENKEDNIFAIANGIANDKKVS